MGILSKSLTQQSSYAAKKTDLWPSLMDRLTDCVLDADVDAFERHLAAIALQIPATWEDSLKELIAKRREEISQEDIGSILRERFDF